MPGILLAGAIVLAVRFIATQYGGPAMLYALLFGMVFNFLASHRHYAPGITLSSTSILRIGVALLGAHITLADVTALGVSTFALVVSGVVATMTIGWWLARRMGLSSDHAALCAGAVAICGASAAMAIAAILPAHKDSDTNTILTVIGVTTLSTVAMIAYPAVMQFLTMDDIEAGIFLGATIHDVAQVIGAGYMISDPAGESATIVKLVRVACLVPAVLVLSMVFGKQADGLKNVQGGRGQSLFAKISLPGFLIAFIVIVALNSLGLLPQWALTMMRSASSLCILIAVAALGVKTSLSDLVKVGPAPLAAMLAQTIFLAGFVAVWLFMF